MKNFTFKAAITVLTSLEMLTVASGQGSSPLSAFQDSVVDPYLDYFSLPQEQVYTHFNKSNYLPGDAIWFKCYAFNPKTKRPSIVTRNLIVELYRPDGKLVGQKVLHAEQGVADNAFFLDAHAPIGEYIFRAYTNWMRNFDGPSSFSSCVNVIGSQQPDTLTESRVDVQFLPESGTLLAGLTNKVGIKAVDVNGKGVRLSGDIVDEKGVAIEPFELNKLGMGSVSLDMTQNTKLYCRVSLAGGQTLTYPLPPAEKQGIIAQVNQHGDRVYMKIATNRQTLLRGQTLYLMVHNRGQVQLVYSITLDPERTSSLVAFDKSELMNGVNYLTIFNEKFEPVAERLFYVNSASIKGIIKEDFTLGEDTVSLQITSLDTDGKPASSNLSLSVLPGESTSNNFSSSLMAEILLKSGLKGTVENPNYYFEGSDTVHLIDLDNLLITQGWRRYNWQLIKDSTSETLEYEIENGFNVSGKVNKWSKSHSNANYQVFLHSSDNNILKLSTVNSLGMFSFDNLCFTDSALIYLTVLNKNGRNMYKKVTASVAPVYKSVSSIQKPKNFFINPMANFSVPTSLLSGDIMIEEVKVFGKKPEAPPASKIFGAYEGKTFTITDENSGKYRDVNDVLRQEFGVSSIKVRDSPPTYKYYMNRGINSINFKHEVLLIVDDIPTRLDDVTKYCSMSNIESISVNKTGYGLGARGVDGAIIIKTRTKPLFSRREHKTTVNALKVRGYATPVSYYTPKYKVLPPDPDYIKYATVFWQPNVLTDQAGKTTVKFPVPPELNSVEIRIEGFADNGTVFLENKKIAILRPK